MTLRHLAIKNFKRFSQLSVRLAPLSILTGLNGSGKTSVLHSLLLARQASASPQPVFVQLNGPFGLQLGEAHDVVHWDADPDEGIEIELKDDTSDAVLWRFAATEERSLNLRVLDRPEAAPSALTDNGRAFTYLSAERLGPRDVLGVSSVSTADLGVGHQGEFSAQVLAQFERMPVAPARLHRDTKARGNITTLRAQTEAWLSDIARPVTIAAEWARGSGVTTLRYGTPDNSTDAVRPTNMGFGITYTLPIIIAALLAPVGSLLVIENPEAHLHPAGQSAIGAFLAQIAADGVQIIVETHSDHFINGIRRSIVTHKHLAAGDSVIHFFGNEGSNAARAQIEVQASGDLSNWPKGFFDQMEQDLAALAKARRGLR